jgi:hypothetical protein
MASRDQLDPGACQRVRNLEIGGAEQPEATARPEFRKVPRDRGCHGRIALHVISFQLSWCQFGECR